MFTKGSSRLVILCFSVMLAGCATSRSEIKLDSPAIVAPTTTATTAQPVVVIGKITDERVFEHDPRDPSTPSLGFGGPDKATADVKARAVARKRNGYGLALGDVLLQQGKTVEDVVRENLAAAFQQAGYQVRGESDAGPSPLVVDVHIKQFWAWFTPGAFVVTLSDNIATDLVFNGVGAPVVVSAHVEKHYAIATDKDWIQIVDNGLDAYRAEVLHRIQSGDGIRTAATTAGTPSTPSVDEGPGLHSSGASAAGASTATSTGAVEASSVVPAPSASPAVASEPAVPAESATPVAPASSSTAVASTASTAMAQGVATQIGCGTVQANGGSTFVASCGSYSVLIDCDGGQCRPMHTIKGKDND
jgi:hypothetical protein